MQEQLENQIASLQLRMKKLSGTRDQLIRDQGAAERKLEEAREKLLGFGIDTAGLGSKELQSLAEDLELKLAATVAALTVKVEEGEALVAKYQQVKGA